jgi:hypothetical protein
MTERLHIASLAAKITVHYPFTVDALSAPLDAKEGLDQAALLKAMEGQIPHILTSSHS